MQRITRTIVLAGLAGWNAATWAVTLDPLFADNMVLQRDAPIAVSGRGSEAETVTVGFNGATTTAQVCNGRWKAVLPAMKAGGPFELTVAGHDALTVTNVLVGDVWLCTGQSNMATLLKLYKGKEYTDYHPLFAGIPQPDDKLRLFRVRPGAADAPQREAVVTEEFGYGWRVCDVSSAMDFSALGYLFGSKLRQEIGVPVGLIQAAVGATSAECWVSMETLQGNPELRSIIEKYEAAKQNYPAAWQRFENEMKKWTALTPVERQGVREPREPMGPKNMRRPTALYNFMIAPLQRLAIKGVIWYQGEGNVGQPVAYRTLFPALITSWRREWGQRSSSGRDFPFLFVQLAAYDKVAPEPGDSDWAWLREAQAMTLSLPNTGMAVAIDAGHQTHIHPPYKPLVADRLVAVALKVAYGRDRVASGPTFRRMAVKDNKAVIEFDNVGGGLVGREVDLDGGIHLADNVLKGFAICGEDKVFKWAEAVIEGGTVVVIQPDVSKPVAVRYGWAKFPLGNLYNKEGFPAVPFRTDQFAPEP